MKRSHVLVVGVVAVAIGAGYGIGYWRNNGFSGIGQSQAEFVGFEPDEVRLGTHLWGENIPLQLDFVNRGTDSIIIESVESNCGCTLIDTEKYKGQTVVLGGSLKLNAQFNTGKNPGAKKSSISLKTASGRVYSCNVQVDVEGTWSLSPDAVDFGEVVMDQQDGGEIATSVSFFF